MLRLTLVLLALAVGASQALRGPFYTLLFYLWVAYFRPESWVYSDLIVSLNISFVVGVLVLLQTLLSGERIKLSGGAVLLLLFLLQGLVSTLLSPVSDYAWRYWIDFAKVVTMGVLIVSFVNDEKRLRLVLLVIAMSLGVDQAKQGWAQLILAPGARNDNEIPLFGDNNNVAVGMLMLTPLLVALARTASSRWERWGERFMAVGILYRGISTYSRGGFLSCAMLALHYVIRSKRRVVGLLAVVLIAGIIFPVLPENFWDRMETVQDASQDIEGADESIRGRLHFWGVAVDMAADYPLFGVGHNAYNAMYDRYDTTGGRYKTGRSVHSTWFGVLAERGYPGLLLFLVILVYALRQCARARKLAAVDPAMRNMALYGNAIEAALLVLTVGGTFVIFQYNEMVWHLLALSMAIGRIVSAAEANRAAETSLRSPLPAVRTQVAMVAVSPVAR